MSSSIVQFKDLIEQLQSDEYRCTALNELKNVLTFNTNIDALSTIRHVGITKIMHCLNISDKYVIKNIIVNKNYLKYNKRNITY